MGGIFHVAPNRNKWNALERGGVTVPPQVGSVAGGSFLTLQG